MKGDRSGRNPPVRTKVGVVAALFLAAAGVGALVARLAQRGDVERDVVVEKVVTHTSSDRPAAARASTRRPRTQKAAASASNTPPVPDGSRESFVALAARLPGEAGVAIAPLGAGSIQTFGATQVGRAWSTSKVPVLVTLLREDEASRHALGSAEAADAALALEQSDNAAIEDLFARLEQTHGGLLAASRAVQQTLRHAGDEHTAINTIPNDEGFTTYGQTEWSLTGEVTFYRALARGCLLDAADTSYVLQLMRSVTASQRWGAGSAGYPSSTPVAFKGGWGPDANDKYQVRQTAIVGAGNRGYVISMLALPASGSFADGTAMITALSGWARHRFSTGLTAPAAQCAGSH